MNFVQMSAEAENRTRLHGGPVAGERRAFRDLRAETGEFHAAERNTVQTTSATP